MLQQFKVPAGGRVVNAQASTFRLEAVAAVGGDESVKVRADGQDLGTYLPGDSITLPKPAVMWEITPVTPAATAMVRLGVAGVESSRVYGNVAIIDTARAAVLADREFVNSINSGSGAGLFATGELWNGTTDKGIAIRGLSIASDTAQPVAIGGVTTELAATVTTPINGKRISATGYTNPANIRRNSKNTSAAQDPVTLSLLNLALTANVRSDFPLYGTPIVIGPGSGLRMSCTVAQTSLSVLFACEVFDWQ